ncbi:hypothetical protein CHR55_27260 [Rhodococcus qingshengii]|uniref:Uncharacterized protein n=2 Tax=Rhodococcus qingshengii TaxID=334542 RepID=A0A2A5J461_RHOSG|nr:hypothetical protein CHR55_27260 [Rhodococcus qingshengii]
MTWTDFSRKALPGLKAQQKNVTPQYVLCPYDSIERRTHQVVVVTDAVTTPTVVRAPRARSNRKPIAIALPSLDALTLPLAQSAVRVQTDYIVLRHLFTNAVIRKTFPMSVEQATESVAAA